MTENLSTISGPPIAEEQGLGALTLGGFIAEIAERYPDNEAVVYRDCSGVDHSWSYVQLYEGSVRVARSLLACGVTKDARVGILCTNRPEWLLSIFGAALAGAVGVAISTFSTRRELEHQLKIADVEILLMEAEIASHNFVADLNEMCPELAQANPGRLYSPQFPFLRRIVVIDSNSNTAAIENWDRFLEHGASIPETMVAATSSSVSEVDNGLVFFSSGSTAMPKAILQRHRAASLQCWRFGRWFKLDSGVRCWSANGFFWSGNFAMALGGTLGVGGCLVLQRYFDPDETLEILQREKVTQAIAWPHQEARLKECAGWESADLSCLHYVDAQVSVFASHPTVDTTWRQPTGYGMTETFTFVTGLIGSEAPEGSHGKVLHGNILRIVDPLSGEVLPWGEKGEIIVKGPTLTPGYLKVAPELSFDTEGFIHTGDAGYLREDGHLHWEGRLSDIIKTGGANVSPTEIDSVLAEHTSIQSAFTVGIPHETLGELVVSCVVPRQGEILDESLVKAFLRESLASFKVPRRVLFFSEDDLPMTGSSKVRRGELKELVIERIAAE